MNLPENAIILHMDSPTFASDLAAALGIQQGEPVQIYGPQFDRTDGKQVEQVSFTPEQWAAMYTKSTEELKQLGLGIWDKTEETTHFLFPKEWYSIIPAGMMITYIDGKSEPFQPGITDDDYRFGCLAYGFIKPN